MTRYLWAAFVGVVLLAAGGLRRTGADVTLHHYHARKRCAERRIASIGLPRPIVSDLRL